MAEVLKFLQNQVYMVHTLLEYMTLLNKHCSHGLCFHYTFSNAITLHCTRTGTFVILNPKPPCLTITTPLASFNRNQHMNIYHNFA